MKKMKLISTLIALFAMSGVYAQTAQEVQAKFNEAAAALNNKQYTQAAPLFQEVIDLGETAEGDVSNFVKQAKSYMIMAYMNDGKLNAQKKNFDGAITDFTKAKEAAIAYMDLRSRQTAETMISAVYGVMANAKISEKDFAGAADIAYKAYTENDKDIKNGLFAAQNYSKAGNEAKAEEVYNKLIKLGESSPRFASAKTSAINSMAGDKLNAAIAALQAKDYDKAIANVEAATAIAKTPNILMANVQIYNDAKKYDKVVAVGPEAVAAQTTPDHKSNAAFFVAIAYQELGNKAKAIEYYKQVTAGANAETAKKLVTQLAAQE